MCAAGVTERVTRHLRAAGLPTHIKDIPGGDVFNPDTLTALMHQDKKTVGGQPALILARGIGQAFVSREQTWAQIRDFLAGQCR